MKKYSIILLGVLVLALFSCSHHSPFKEENYFSSLGENGEIVITIGGNFLKEQSLFTLSDSFEKVKNRVDRLTISSKSEGNISFTGEGNFSSSLLSLAGLEKVKSSSPSLYKMGSNVISSPLDGIVLCTPEDEYDDFYKRTILERKEVINKTDSLLMSEGDISLYVKNPVFLPELSLGINDAVIDEIDKVLFIFSFNNEDGYLSGYIDAKNEKSAKTLLVLLKNNLIQNIKRSGTRLDINEISNIFTISENKIVIEKYHLTEENLSLFSKVGEGVI